MPRNGRVTDGESCHDPPQATGEWEEGWDGEERKKKALVGGHRMAMLTLWYEVVWNESVGPCGQHTLGVISHEGVGLDVQIPEHFVRSPPADEADDVRVNSGEEEGGGTSGPKTAGRDVGGEETKVWATGHDGVSNSCCKEGCGDCAGGVVYPRQGRGRGRRVPPQVDHLTDDCLYWA